MKILVLGGYGVFGSRVCRLLLDDGFDVIVAGRSIAKAAAFVAKFGGTALALDKSDATALRNALSGADVVIDAIGPFQAYRSSSIAELAIQCGCHYLDLSDDADFTTAISTLDAQAKAVGVVVLSGVSTVPAISSAIVDALSEGLAEITLIDTAILPGNRAPRGRSVMDAILSQVGRPLAQWRGGEWIETPAWSGAVTVGLPKGLNRPASPIGAPDLRLFPKRYAARSVLFRAGLELRTMHHGLRFFGWLHRLGFLPRLDKLTVPMLFAAKLLKGFGSDQGGMSVKVAGRTAQGTPVTRGWRLHMSQGRGPFVPSVPALILVRHIAAGKVAPGAGPAMSCFTRAELEEVLSKLTGQFDGDVPDATPLFEAALGADAWTKMPQSYRDGHDLWDRHEMVGSSSVTRGSGLAARLIAALFRFPPERAETPLRVTMERVGSKEVWTRNFDGQVFRSVLSPAGRGRLRERFGLFEFELELPTARGEMQMIVRKGWFLGVPMPRWALPVSETREFDQDGRFQFDVRLSAPLAGFIVHYRGSLERADHSAASLGGSEGSLSLG
ncbi:MAG: DUF4166 domain-containing protein [Pseudomonadota bacterium]